MSAPVTTLSPIEHLFTGRGSSPITFAFAFAGRLDHGALQRGLERTLTSFPWLATELRAVAEATWGLVPTAGLRLGDAGPVPELDDGAQASRWVAPVATRPGEPLARFTLGHTPAGSALAASVSHALVDGFSFFHFMTSWARACRGEDFFPPTRHEVPRAGWQGTLDPETVRRETGLTLGPRRPESGAQWKPVTVRFTRAELDALRAEAQASSPVRLSTHDVVTAVLWRDHGARWAAAGGQGACEVSCPVDFRGFVEPLTPAHFGCAIAFATSRATLEEVRGASLGALATRVRQATSAVDAARVATGQGLLAELRRREGVDVVERLHVRDPLAGMVVTNLTRLPLQDIDFGGGPPRAFTADAQLDRGAALFPTADGLEARLNDPLAADA